MRGEQAVLHLVVGQVAALGIVEFLLLGLDAVEHGDSVVGHAVIVAPHHRDIVGIGAYDHYVVLGRGFDGQDAVVLEEHGALEGCGVGFLAGRGIVLRDGAVQHGEVQQAVGGESLEYAAAFLVHQRFTHGAVLHKLADGFVIQHVALGHFQVKLAGETADGSI